MNETGEEKTFRLGAETEAWEGKKRKGNGRAGGEKLEMRVRQSDLKRDSQARQKDTGIKI